MKLVLQRTTPAGKPRTFGELLHEDGARICFTLEDQVRTGPKVHGQTAIPTGLYRITMEPSPRFGPDTLTVNKVPGFEYVRIHGGNNEHHTEGCPLVGLKINEAGIVGGTSQPALKLLKELVRQAFKRGEGVTLEVVNA